ncbi:neurotrypsin-like [Mizuhopecten yessoensis]|uniref:neurotrypsin-like n=1 Tax=Mizuhopecten yessoensis TaxID=6573 RepID=UPI000B45F40C|nr:neurotrypsin-like [Mizuhopecten yessoensis]
MTDRILCVVFMGFSFLTSYVEGSLRLIGGDDQYEGRIEIYDNGEWQTICRDHWDLDNTFVACRQLGLKDGLWRRVESSEVSGNTFWSVEKDCNGNESGLQACDSKEVDSSRCTHSGRDEVYVTCQPQKE